MLKVDKVDRVALAPVYRLGTKSTVSATVDFVVDLLPVSATALNSTLLPVCTELKNFKQEALSQRSRAMLRVIEYFAKSRKVTQGHWKWDRSIEYEFLLAFRSNYYPILYHFRDKARY